MSNISDAFNFIMQGDIEPRDRKNLEELRNTVQYWSYCMWQGMLRECPEKKEELLGFLSDLDIHPYRGTKS